MSLLHRNLSPVQFMGLDELKTKTSGDWQGTVGEMQPRWERAAAAEGHEFGAPLHQSHRPYGIGLPAAHAYLDDLTKSVAANGIKKPLEFKGDVLKEGHHRAMAAMAAGVARVPYRTRLK